MTIRRTVTLHSRLFSSLVLALAITACGDDSDDDDGAKPDTGVPVPDAQVPKDGGTPGIDSGADAGPRPDAGPTSDASTPVDAAVNGGMDAATADAGADAATTTPDAAVVIPTLNGCAPGDYQDRSASGAMRIVEFGGATGQAYAPKCITISAGQLVRFQGNFVPHPLAPGNKANPTAGSPNNPITNTATGASKEVTFPAAGTYPYYCTEHSDGAGLGMAGSVHVK